MSDADRTKSTGGPAHEHASVRDWPGYFRAVAGRPPRETLLRALALFEAQGVPDAGGGAPLAVDLGCGEGRDTAELLRRGWRVLAIDGHEEAVTRTRTRPDLPPSAALELRCAAMEGLELPRCLLINSSFTLPFCAPAAFDGLWEGMVGALEPGGRFAGQLFGDRDTWAALPDRSHQTRSRVEALLGPFEVEMLEEEDRPGETTEGQKKRWHVFHIVARKR